MHPQEINPVLKEALFAHEVLRSLGFEADEIFLLFDPDDEPEYEIGVGLRTQGKSFNWGIGLIINHAGEDIPKAWTEAVNLWNATDPEDDSEWKYKESESFAHAAGVYLKLKLMGFDVPLEGELKKSDLN
jgi:hypothetical protein